MSTNRDVYSQSRQTTEGRARLIQDPAARDQPRLLALGVAGHGGMELGALTAMTHGFKARERCLDILELVTGLRMNHASLTTSA